MKLRVKTAPVPRFTAAMLRNGLTNLGVPDECPIRKCHRDRFCAGPLVRVAEDDGLHLARTDAADVGAKDLALPLCFLCLTEATRVEIEQAVAEGIRVIAEDPGIDVVEATRVLSARSWRRLRGVAG